MNEALRDGKITSAMIDPQDANAVSNTGSFNVYPVPSGYYVYIAYNQRDNGWEGLKNPQVRQAISMAISKPAIINEMYLGFAEPAFSFIPPYSPWYTESTVKKYGMTSEADREKSIELIKNAGYEMKEIDGQKRFVDKDGLPIKLNFLIDMGSDFDQNLAILVRVGLTQIGLDINPKFSTKEIIFKDGLMNKVPGSEANPSFNGGPKAVGSQPWDLIMLAAYGDALSVQGSQVLFSSTGKYNYFGYYNEKIDVLYNKVQSIEGVNPVDRQKIYDEIVQTISNDQPVDFLAYYKDNFAFRSNIKGVEPGYNILSNSQFWYAE
jgi:ABC-type transport system substrate-binding protein